MKRLVLIATLSAALAACGGGDGDVPADAAAGGPDAMFCPPGSDAGTAAANGELAGRWATFTSTLAQVSGLGGAQRATSLYLQEVTQNGTELTVVETMCSLRIDSVDGFTKVRVTPAFISGVPPENRTGAIVESQGSFDYNLEQTFTTRGVTLVDEANDPLPTDPTDPRIGDWDGDGNVGMTLLIDGILSGVAFVIQRDHSASAGTQVSADRIEGHITWGAEQVMLESDPASLKDLDSPVFPDSDPDEHTFQAVRIPADADCAWIVANACNLFED